jgi:hypothetical protein
VNPLSILTSDLDAPDGDPMTCSPDPGAESDGGAGDTGQWAPGAALRAPEVCGGHGPAAYVPPPEVTVAAYPAVPPAAPAYQPYPAAQPTYQPYPAQPYPAQPYPATPGYQPYPAGSEHGYGVPYGPYRQGAATDGLAIASLAVSCASVLGLCAYGIGGLLGIVGAILGHVARGRIRRSGSGGEGLALAGVIVGWISAALGLAAVTLIGVLIYFGTASGTS